MRKRPGPDRIAAIPRDFQERAEVMPGASCRRTLRDYTDGSSCGATKVTPRAPDQRRHRLPANRPASSAPHQGVPDAGSCFPATTRESPDSTMFALIRLLPHGPPSSAARWHLMTPRLRLGLIALPVLVVAMATGWEDISEWFVAEEMVMPVTMYGGPGGLGIVDDPAPRSVGCGGPNGAGSSASGGPSEFSGSSRRSQ
jgi:hypothetical protein